jgi:hypothetical protein
MFIGVRRGDRVAIYLPMIMELPVAMYACARIGAVHSVVVGDIRLHTWSESIFSSPASRPRRLPVAFWTAVQMSSLPPTPCAVVRKL